jgi:hypothetical protein
MELVQEWRRTLRDNAAGYARVALDNIAREFPSHVIHLMAHVGDFPARPRERTPIFYGSFDWHSCVEMHWLLVRLLRTVPDAVPEDEIRSVLDAQFAEEAVSGEVGFVTGGDGRGERPYGWGWALQLMAELAAWEDAYGRRWRERLEPLAKGPGGGVPGLDAEGDLPDPGRAPRQQRLRSLPHPRPRRPGGRGR